MAPQTFTSGSSMVDAAVAYMTVPPTPPPDPEAMATRVLIKRHKEEHDSLIETFMEGLDWDR